MFFRKKRKIIRRAPPWIVCGVSRERQFRQRVGLWLRVRSRRLSPTRLRFYCFAFILAGSLIYTWIIVLALRGGNPAPIVRSIELRSGMIRHQVAIDPTPPPSFRQFLDSINKTPELKRHFDSLMIARPGFADTIRQLEGFFPDKP